MFKVGDKVICVNVDKVDGIGAKIRKIKLGSMYTIQAYLPKTNLWVEQICVEEVDDVYYNAKRFKKVRRLKLERVLNGNNI